MRFEFSRFPEMSEEAAKALVDFCEGAVKRRLRGGFEEADDLEGGVGVGWTLD